MADSRAKNGATIKPDPGFFMTVEAASMVGCNPHTLRRWRKNGVFTPANSMMAGTINVPLYTEKDIKAMKSLYQERRDHIHRFPTGKQ